MEAAFDSNPSSYEIKSELSNCCFGIGIVYLAKHVPSQQFVAVKKFQMDKAKEESNLIRVRFCEIVVWARMWYNVYCFILQEEILTMRQFDCDHVLSLYTAFVKNSDVYVISPLMCYNSCRDAMNSYFTTGKFIPPEHSKISFDAPHKKCHCFRLCRRFPRNNRLPYITWHYARIGIHSSKRIYSSVNSCQSYSNQSNKSGFVRIPWTSHAHHEWPTHPKTVWSTTE